MSDPYKLFGLPAQAVLPILIMFRGNEFFFFFPFFFFLYLKKEKTHENLHLKKDSCCREGQVRGFVEYSGPYINGVWWLNY